MAVYLPSAPGSQRSTPRGGPFKALALGVVLLLSLSACASSSASPSAAESVAAPASAASSAAAPSSAASASVVDGGTLKIGMMTGLSGGFAPWGLQFQDTMNLWAKMVNDGTLAKWSSIVAPSGGIVVGGKSYKVEIDPYDTKNDIATASAGISKLILQDNVKYILGPVGETEAFANAMPLFDDNGVLNLQLSTLWQAQGANYPMSLNILTDMQDYYQAVYQWMVDKHPEIKRVSIITTDQTYGRLGALVAHKYERDSKAFKIVSEAYVPYDTTDYNAVVTQALAQHPDVIDIGGAANPNAFTGILTAAYQQGFKGVAPAGGGDAVKFMATSWNPDLVLANVPSDYFNGVVQGYPTASWGPDGPTDEASWFYAQMLTEYGNDEAKAWNTVSPGGYYAGRVLLEGMKAADSVDPKAIAAALVALPTVNTPMGPAGWTGKTLSGADHALVFPERVLQRQNGKYVVAGMYAAPFTWNYDWAGLPGADQFKPNQ